MTAADHASNSPDITRRAPERSRNVPRVERWQIDLELYPADAIFRACYKFTDRCFIRLERSGKRTVMAELRARDDKVDIDVLLGEFANELIDQRLRLDIARETKAVRDLIVTQAFVETGLDPGSRDDHRGSSRTQEA
jgi:His-Xaa-Ser system protein HxsD